MFNMSSPIPRSASSVGGENEILGAFLRSHETVPAEMDTELAISEGQLPAGLRGVALRMVPGRMERGGVRYGHPFDGDGMVLRFAIGGGRIHYRNRFVRTQDFIAEERAGRMLKRSFGTDRPGGLAANCLRLKFKNAANVSLVHHAGMLLALWDNGLPHRLDPTTLETLGAWDFDGELRDHSMNRWLNGGVLPFGAHPSVDSETGALESFAMVFGPQPAIRMYSVNPAGRLTHVGKYPLDGLGFIHDFRNTPRYRVFFDSSVRINVARMLLGLANPATAISYDARRPLRALLVPRDGGAPIVIPSSSSGFLYHFANAFEDEDGRIVADAFLMHGYPDLSDFWNIGKRDLSLFPKPRLTRFTIDPARRTMTETMLAPEYGDFSTIHPARKGLRQRFVWYIASPPTRLIPYHTGLIKVDLEDASRTVFRDFGSDLPGEPSFIPRDANNESDAGWLVLTLYVAAEHRSELLVLDASTLRTICRARLPHHVPRGFHGTWLDTVA
jgi:all-trans-8'-apo-beta-carotenal 15,15'-oxygenase